MYTINGRLAGDAEMANLSWYVDNQPVVATDPLGLHPVIAWQWRRPLRDPLGFRDDIVNDRFDLTPLGSLRFDPPERASRPAAGPGTRSWSSFGAQERSVVDHVVTSFCIPARRFSLSR